MTQQNQSTRLVEAGRFGMANRAASGAAYFLMRMVFTAVLVWQPACMTTKEYDEEQARQRSVLIGRYFADQSPPAAVAVSPVSGVTGGSSSEDERIGAFRYHTASALSSWLEPLIRSYLGSEPLPRLVIRDQQQDFLWSQGENILVISRQAILRDDTAADDVLSRLAGELWAAAFSPAWKRRSQVTASPAAPFTDAATATVLVEGMRWHIARQGQSPQNPALQEVYNVTRDELSEISEQFAAGELPAGRVPLSQARIGAYMAARIEETHGRKGLFQAIYAGPEAFFEAYRATAPYAALSFDFLGKAAMH